MISFYLAFLIMKTNTKNFCFTVTRLRYNFDGADRYFEQRHRHGKWEAAKALAPTRAIQYSVVLGLAMVHYMKKCGYQVCSAYLLLASHEITRNSSCYSYRIQRMIQLNVRNQHFSNSHMYIYMERLTTITRKARFSKLKFFFRTQYQIKYGILSEIYNTNSETFWKKEMKQKHRIQN